MKTAKLLLLTGSVFVAFATPSFAGSAPSAHAGHEQVESLQKSCKMCKKKQKCSSTRHYKKSMEKMHHAMMIEYSGDADVDFVRGMIPHHQGAIDMAKIQLKYGKDEALRDLAQRIILAQEEEIAFMQSWLRGRDSAYKSANAKTATSTVEFEKIMADMHKNMTIKYSGNSDVDFARGMIPHHQGAIDMAWVLKREGSAPELRAMLDDIIRSQSQEIDMMKEWLENNKK